VSRSVTSLSWRRIFEMANGRGRPYEFVFVPACRINRDQRSNSPGTAFGTASRNRIAFKGRRRHHFPARSVPSIIGAMAKRRPNILIFLPLLRLNSLPTSGEQPTVLETFLQKHPPRRHVYPNWIYRGMMEWQSPPCSPPIAVRPYGCRRPSPFRRMCVRSRF
jgi:hypothetical protein